MTEDGTTPERRIVLHPRTAAARQHGRRATLGRRTRGFLVDEESVAALVARQRRLALRTMVVLVIVVFGLPTALIALPGLGSVRVSGLPPLHWLAAGLGLYLILVVMGWRHERAANAVDDEWARESAEP